MTAKEKAKELVDKLKIPIETLSEGYTSRYSNVSKQCALICVDEKQKTIEKMFNGYYTMTDNWKKEYDNLEEVKQEINKL